MEEELVSSLPASRSMDTGSKRRKVPVFLGFFLQPHIVFYPKYKPPPPAKFLHCSEEGKGVQEGEWGSLDASLSFLDMPRKHIMGSSNGLLLCCADFFEENLHYVVCNPVTREFNVIPHPDKVYRCVTVTFICKKEQ
nr:uncharacterized protein LOC117276077 [Nicotiana tomentosiformis]